MVVVNPRAAIRYLIPAEFIKSTGFLSREKNWILWAVWGTAAFVLFGCQSKDLTRKRRRRTPKQCLCVPSSQTEDLYKAGALRCDRGPRVRSLKIEDAVYAPQSAVNMTQAPVSNPQRTDDEDVFVLAIIHTSAPRSGSTAPRDSRAGFRRSGPPRNSPRRPPQWPAVKSES